MSRQICALCGNDGIAGAVELDCGGHVASSAGAVSVGFESAAGVREF